MIEGELKKRLLISRPIGASGVLNCIFPIEAFKILDEVKKDFYYHKFDHYELMLLMEKWFGVLTPKEAMAWFGKKGDKP